MTYPEMIVKKPAIDISPWYEYFHWHFRYFIGKEPALALRCRIQIASAIVGIMVEELKRKGLIKRASLIYDSNVKYHEGWDTWLNFDLCPCIELSRSKTGQERLNSIRIQSTFDVDVTWEYKLIKP